MSALGIDFGTSNTAASILVDGTPRLLELEPGETTLPTVVFLDFGAGKTLYGRNGVSAMTSGQDGRFMRALKSILGTPLAREKRQFLNEKLSLIEVIARFLGEIRARAEQSTGATYDQAVSGRPVRFHSKSEARNAQAAVDLEEAYHLAGFSSVSFLPEPEAAALATGGSGRMLIVDIGGGTSDFTLCDRVDGETRIHASQGIRMGGTDFDRILNLSHAMPLLGYGAEIGNEMGSGSHTAPRALFHDLAAWEKIAFVYSPSLLRDVKKWVRLAPEAHLFERLADVLEMHLGHDIAYAIEAGKIRANSGDSGRVVLDVVESGLEAWISPQDVRLQLAAQAEEIAACAQETLDIAGCPAASVDRIVYVGGSSLMSVIRQRIEAMFPNAVPETSEVFTAVASGLALEAARR
ncbi:MAG: Hsp70 family protein [Paracoccaceae bacterium]